MLSAAHRTFLRLLGAVTLGLCLSAASPARAQTDEQRAAARSMATNGSAAFNEGRYKDAIDLFTRAEALVHAPPHLLYLARSEEKLGRLVASREAYLKIVKETLPAGAPQAFRDAQVAADQELRQVEPRIASLQVSVEGAQGAQDLAVVVNGQPIASVLVGVPRPVDPGEYQIEATAQGLRAPAQAVSLGEGQKKAVVLTLAADPNAAPVQPTQGSAVMDAQGGPDLGTGGGKKGLRIGSYVALGVGVVGVGLGTYFLIDSKGKRSDADDAFAGCEASGGCAPDDPAAIRTAELDDDADSAKTRAIIGYVVGGVGLAAGVTLFFLSAEPEPSPSGLSVRPYLGLGEAGLTGRF